MTRSVSFKRDSFQEEADAPVLQERTLSDQQAAARDWARTGKGNAILTAVAGAGKTTTLINAILPELQGFADYVVYNKKAQLDVQPKVARVQNEGRVHCRFMAGTFHSFGWGAWRRANPECKIEGLGEGNAGYYKFKRIWEEMTAEDVNIQPAYRGFVKKLASLAKQRALGSSPNLLPNYGNMMEIVNHFDLEDALCSDSGDFIQGVSTDEGIALAQKALQRSNQLAREVIDYDDMIYMPITTSCRVWQNNWLMIDEAQDTNPARRLLAKKMLRPYDGRMIWVGDRHQAIYGFTGADNDSLAQIEHDFRCQQLPLTVTYRCPKKVVELAQKWVSHITAHESAPEGEVIRMPEREFHKLDNFGPNDAILCRKNAPLISLAYQLISRGIPCYVEGRDIGANLMELANRWTVSRLDALTDRLRAYKTREIIKLISKGQDALADSISDRVETLLALIAGMPRNSTVADLQTRVSTMFQDSDGNRRKCLTLCSVHKSKGLEWPRVFLWGRNAYMPSKYARQPWQIQQEANLCYVAVTRAMNTLVEVIVEAM